MLSFYRHKNAVLQNFKLTPDFTVPESNKNYLHVLFELNRVYAF